MEIKKLQERRLALISGLQNLEEQFETIKSAIVIQRGAIGECDFWISQSEQVEVPKEVSKVGKKEKVIN